MRDLTVNETLNFERGEDPIKSMGIGSAKRAIELKKKLFPPEIFTPVLGSYAHGVADKIIKFYKDASDFDKKALKHLFIDLIKSGDFSIGKDTG
jgi:hypothetical protein